MSTDELFLIVHGDGGEIALYTLTVMKLTS